MPDHLSSMSRQQLIGEVNTLSNRIKVLEKELHERRDSAVSSNQYEFIVNTSKDLLSLIDYEYRYIAVNDTYCRAHKLSREEIIGHSVADIWGKETFKEIIEEKLIKCLTGEEVTYRAKFMLPASGLRSMEVTYYPYCNAEGKFTHAVVVSRDATEEKAVENKLVAFEKAFETMQIGVTISSCDGNILYTNPAEAAMHGYTPDELLGKKVAVFAPEDAYTPAVPAMMSTIGSWRRERVNIDRTGRQFPVNLMSDLVRNQDGEPLAVVTTCEDISDRKQTELKLKQKFDQITVLRELDMLILANLEIRELLNILLSHLVCKLAVNAAAVTLRNQSTNSLEIAASFGFNTTIQRTLSLRFGEGLTGRVAFERSPLHIPDIRSAGVIDVPSELVEKEGFQFYYGIPLIAKGEVVGVLEVFHRSPFVPDDEWTDFFQTLAGQAALAIDYTLLFRNLQHSRDRLMIAYDTTIEGWSRALDYRDKETEGHSRRVTEMTLKVARHIGLGDQELVHVRRGALLHDIGKLGVPDGILHKPDQLTEEEWAVMRKHPEIAFELLSPISFLRPAITIPYCHHEKWDGTGYPRGLSRDRIPLEARIFSIVDVWDALSNNRYYRTAWQEEQVRSHITHLSGSHFDPDLVGAFFRVVNERPT